MMIFCREGVCSCGRIPLTSHALDIPQRLKEILPTAFIMLDRATGRYEIHDEAQTGGTLACVLPFDALDARTIGYVRRYRRERLEQTAREIDAHNERLERRAAEAHLDRAGEQMREALRYLSAHEQCSELPKEMMKP